MWYKQLETAIQYAKKNKSFNLLNVIDSAENVCVFGLGTYFKEAFASQGIKQKFHVNLLCDNNPEKWGKTIEGLKCISPDELKKYNSIVVIIMVGNPIPIEKQLKDMGIPCMTHLGLSMDYIMDMPRQSEWFESEADNIIKAFELLEDEESKRVYVNGLCNRIAPPVSQYTWQELATDEEEYFNQNHFKLDDNEVYVDCGAYNGDSVMEFCNEVQSYDKIFAFELDINNFNSMKENLRNCKNVTMYNYGVWDENKIIEYGTGTGENEPMDGISVFKTEKNENNSIKKAQVKRLDDILCGERVTFIKMDVEGSEVNALKGAREILKNQKPKLAICLYHKTSDFWQIPLLIKEINSDYRLVIRHNVPLNIWDTILYAY